MCHLETAVTGEVPNDGLNLDIFIYLLKLADWDPKV